MSCLNLRTIKTSHGCFQQQGGGRDRRVHTYPECSGRLESTTIYDAQTASSHTQSSMDDGSFIGWDRGIFSTRNTKKSHFYNRSLYEGPQFQSPAKVFAKLKANVRRNTGGMQSHEKDGSVLRTPRKGTENTREAKLTTNETSTFYHNDAEAMTISPTKSPQHELPKSFSNRTQYREPSPVKDTRHGVMERNMYTPIKTPGRLTSQVLLSHRATPSRSSKDIVRTPSKGQPQQLSNSEFGRRPVIVPMVCLERCPLMSPAKMFAYIKKRERKGEHKYSPERNFMNTAHACQPIRAVNADGKNDVRMELSDDESQSLVDPSDTDPRSLDEPTNSLLGNHVTDDRSPSARHPVDFNHLWLHDSKAFVSKRQDLISLENLVSPAKTHMKERERQQQREADDVRRTRDRREAGHRVSSRKRPHMDAFDQLPKREDNRFQSEATADPIESCQKDNMPFPARKPLLVLAEDPLVNHSPHVLIPKKHKSIKRKPAPLDQSQPKQLPVQKGSGYELTKWSIKFTKEGLYVDGIRTSDNIAWHSTIIVERISRDVLKTASGKTYTLIGKMNTDGRSKLPNWLLNKFVHGFPSMWKMHFERFISEAKKTLASSSRASLPRGPTTAQPPAENAEKKQRSTPFVTPSCPPPGIVMKKSRSGRLIKPPLEFWKGGRVVMDNGMNVTIMEDYYETPVCKTKSFTPDAILESQPPKPHGGVLRRCGEAPQSPVLQRKVKPARRDHKAKTLKPPKDRTHPPEKGQRRDATSSGSSPEEQGDGARRMSARQRALQEAALKTRPLTRRRDPPKQHFNNAASEGRVWADCAGRVPETALPREPNIPASKKPTVAPSDKSTSDEEVPVRRKSRRKAQRKKQRVLHDSTSSQSLSSSDGSWTMSRKDKEETATRKDIGETAMRKDIGETAMRKDIGETAMRKDIGETATRKDKGKGRSQPQKPAPAPRSAAAQTRGAQSTAPRRGLLQEEEDKEKWTEAELASLKEAMASFPKHAGSYWVNVAMMVGTRSPEDCQTQHMVQTSVKAPSKKARVSQKKESTADEAPTSITARVGTLKRKQQVWAFMEAMPKEDSDDVFSSSSMQARRFQMPSMTPSRKEQGFVISDQEPTTPRGTSYCTVKTPPGLHITPGMIRSVNRKKDDNYIYQLQKRIKRSQVNACKLSPPTKTFPLTPSLHRNMRKCGTMDDTSFVIHEMFPEDKGGHDESGEEEDLYFSDSN